jgi:hypothetical protein
MPRFTEDTLVQQTTADYLRDALGWEAVLAYDEETIENFLWDDKTGLPAPAYSEVDVKTLSRDVYRHVHRVYPTIPSPFYAA